MRQSKLSPFTLQVHQLIRQIPRGRVTTYAAVALALGRPHAVRAVGTALGKNPNPGTDCPCHRVVLSDATLGGYALGLRRKIALLRREGVGMAAGRVESKNWYHFSAKRKAQKVTRQPKT